MQSKNINSAVSLTDVFEAIFDEIRRSTEATVSDITDGVITLTGDFSEFIFSDNPANNSSKQLAITKNGETKTLEKFQLGDVSGSFVTLKSKYDEIGLEVGDVVQAVEADPFFFEGTQKSVHLLQKNQPAAMLLNPRGQGVEFSEFGQALNAQFNRVQLVLTDFSEDFKRGNGSYRGRSDGFVSDQYRQYIEKPLAVLWSRFFAKLDGYVFDNGVARATVESDTTTATANFVEFFGDQHNFAQGELENVSGWVIELNIKLINSVCIAE